MEHLETEEKSVSITFKVTPTMKSEIEKLMKIKKWKLSAFIRVAIAKELQVQEEEK